MYGEKYYGANASTFIGWGVAAVGFVSLASGLLADRPVLEVGNNITWSVVSSVVALGVGVALIKSKETIGGVMAIAMVISLLANGVSVNMSQFFRVTHGAYNGFIDATKSTRSGINNVQASAGGNPLFFGYAKQRPLTADELADCNSGAAWTNSNAGLRNCSTGYKWGKVQ